MDPKLIDLCKKYNVDSKIIEEIIEIEKDNVHKKSRQIFGDLRKIIDEAAKKEGVSHDNI
ncbi:MAG: DNA modification system-associated small protein [Candidatus Woesearchaeota archaeon]